MYRTIVVPLDGSPLSEGALPLAYAVAERAGATLHLVHVHHATGAPIVVEGLPVVDSELHSQAQQHERAYLEGLRDRFATYAVATTVAVLAPDEPPDEAVSHVLNEYAEAEGADLIVMATHGRGGLARAWLGSVADALMRHTARPMLLVRPAEGEAQLRPFNLRHILVPLDGSPLAEGVLPAAQALGALFDSDYTLLRSVAPFFIPGYSPVATIAGLEERANAEAQAEAQRYLDGVAERFTAEGRTVQTRVTFAATPAACILDEAEGHGEGLIALATHGHTGLRRALLGSVADKVVRGAEVPVLLVRP